MKEKKSEKELLSKSEIVINELKSEEEDDFIVISKSQIPKVPIINIFPLIKENPIKDSLNKERKNSSDMIERNKIKRIINKQHNLYFKEIIASVINDNEIEQIKDFIADCILYDKNNKTYTGKLFLDRNYMVYFTPQLNSKPNLYFNSDYYIFPLLSISQCITNTNYFGQSNYCKEITLKDGRNFIFKFSPSAFQEFDEIIENFAFPKKSKNYFNFAYSYKKQIKNSKKIKIYDFFNEFKRQGINFNYNSSTNNLFRIMKNIDYKFCESYPKKLIVPYKITDEELKQSSEFRTKNRIPTLTYHYNKNGSCIWRSSQTRGGLSNYPNKGDVLLLTLISNNKKLFIYDARPYLNAMANKLKGAGYENTNNYPDIDIELTFCGMPNIHAVRNSYQKLMNTVAYNTNNNSTLFYNITNSSWYEYIIILIKSSFQIYESVKNKNANVLIHCSDGWDRTSQLCALSQLLLDKYYRTLDGFLCLIEKDWISFGHQFRYRNGFYSNVDSPQNVVNENQFSPIFLQWLDSVYQLMIQNYEKFEFNFSLVLLLAEELYCGKFGTFMFNNDKDREEFEEEKTYSIWNYIKENEKKYLNKLYDKEDEKSLRINYKKIKLWKDYFYRFEKGYKEENYFKSYDKKINSFEDELNKDKYIIEKLSKFISNYSNKEDMEKLDKDCKNIINQFKEKEKKSNSL